MAENSNSFVVKPTLFMVLMFEKGTNNIRKIYFAFRDLHFWGLELDGGALVTTDHDFREYQAILETDEQNGLAQQSALGEVSFLPNQEVSKLFHTLWTKAVNDEDYDKKQWKDLQQVLLDRGYNF